MTHIDRYSLKRTIMYSDSFWKKILTDLSLALTYRFMSHFEIPDPDSLTDNCGVNVASYGDALYAVTESHKIRRIDPNTLETLGDKVSNFYSYLIET